MATVITMARPFLSSNTQDFIEVITLSPSTITPSWKFLSSNTQDFIEVRLIADNGHPTRHS